MSNCEYVRDYYGVPARIGMLVTYKGEPGIIYKDGGNYVAINLDKDKPGVVSLIHPTDPALVYSEEFGKPRKLTRSQQRYRDYLRSELDCTFSEYLGIRRKRLV